MWLLVFLISALFVSLLHFSLPSLRRLRLDFFALMLWGTLAMILVDRSLAFLAEGGELIEVTTDGLVESGLVLGLLMLVPLALAWSLFAFTPLGAKLAS